MQVCLLHSQHVLSFLQPLNPTLHTQVWDLRTLSHVAELRGHSMPVLALLVRDPVLLSCAGRTVRLWCLDTFQCLKAVVSAWVIGAVIASLVSA